MSFLTDSQWIITAFAWAILHSIWQITLVGIVWFLINQIIKKASSSTRYLFSILAMFTIVVISGMTLSSELKGRYPVDNQLVSERVGPQAAISDLTTDHTAPDQNAIKPVIQESVMASSTGVKSNEWINPFILKILVMFWLAGVILLGFRFLIQWLGMRSLANKGVSPFEEEQLMIFNNLKNKIGIKKNITFLQSIRVTSPITFGYFKPIILLPLGMINGFPPAQVEAIILHELAHIRRNDFLINVIQTWLEILFFYHPFVWVVSKKIRTIREELCDDEVIRALSGSMSMDKVNQSKSITEEVVKTDQRVTDVKMLYAETLLNLQKYFHHNKNQLVMNAKSNKGELSSRIHRLFESNQSFTKGKRNINAYLFGLLIVIALASFAFSNINYPTVSIGVDKLNLLYIGIDNPITVAVAGIPTEETKVESEQLIIQDLGNGHYNVQAKSYGKAIIKVTAAGHATKEIEFRVKRIPDPIARIGNSHGGVMSPEKIMKSEGVDAVLDCFEYDAKCAISNYNMTYVAKEADPIESINHSGKHNEKTRELLQMAKPGDIYYFDQVMCKCPGDESERPVNSMVFKIR